MLSPLTFKKNISQLQYLFSISKHAEHRHAKARSPWLPHCRCPPVTHFQCALLSSSSESTGAGHSSSGKASVTKMILRLNLEGGGDPLQHGWGCLHCGAMRGEKCKGKGENPRWEWSSPA